MTYSEIKTLFQEINTGTDMFTNIDLVTLMVLNEMAKRKIRKKTTTITNAGLATSFDLRTEVPDFIDTIDEDSVYAIGTSNNPYFYRKVNNRKFQLEYRNGVSTIVNRTLKLQTFGTSAAPNPLYVDHYSKYLVLDEDGTTEKQKPENDDDTFLFDSVFENCLIEGLMLYSSKKEKDTDEFLKSRQAWLESINEAMLLNTD